MSDMFNKISHLFDPRVSLARFLLFNRASREVSLRVPRVTCRLANNTNTPSWVGVKRMAAFSKVFLCLTLVSMPLIYVPAAQANVIYDWSAACRSGVTPGCTGTATGVLELADAYTPGTTVEASEFVSWSFTSSGVNYSFGAGDLTSISSGGPLPVSSGIELGQFRLNFGASGFFNADPTATSGAFWDTRIPDNTNRAFGVSSLWTLRSQVPEPGTLALMALGIAGIGFRRRNQVRVP